MKTTLSSAASPGFIHALPQEITRHSIPLPFTLISWFPTHFFIIIAVK
jgi:hypothetical protein